MPFPEFCIQPQHSRLKIEIVQVPTAGGCMITAQSPKSLWQKLHFYPDFTPTVHKPVVESQFSL